MILGGARRDRTADLLHAMQALSQLSYGPTEPRTLSGTHAGVKQGGMRFPVTAEGPLAFSSPRFPCVPLSARARGQVGR